MDKNADNLTSQNKKSNDFLIKDKYTISDLVDINSLTNIFQKFSKATCTNI